MDSSPPPSRSPNGLRPWYLVAGMVLTWFVGVYGLNEGFSLAAILRSGRLPDAATAAKQVANLAEAVAVAPLQAMPALIAHSRVTFPLAVGEVLLSGLLVVASGLAMGGRRGARSLALQAIAANAALAVATYVLTPSIRAAWIDGIIRATAGVDLPPQQREIYARADFWHFFLGMKLVMIDLGTLALGAIALTRPRTKIYFEAAARAAERAEEEDP